MGRQPWHRDFRGVSEDAGLPKGPAPASRRGEAVRWIEAGQQMRSGRILPPAASSVSGARAGGRHRLRAAPAAEERGRGRETAKRRPRSRAPAAILPDEAVPAEYVAGGVGGGRRVADGEVEAIPVGGMNTRDGGRSASAGGTGQRRAEAKAGGRDSAGWTRARSAKRKPERPEVPRIWRFGAFRKSGAGRFGRAGHWCHRGSRRRRFRRRVPRRGGARRRWPGRPGC